MDQTIIICKRCRVAVIIRQKRSKTILEHFHSSKNIFEVVFFIAWYQSCSKSVHALVNKFKKLLQMLARNNLYTLVEMDFTASTALSISLM